MLTIKNRFLLLSTFMNVVSVSPLGAETTFPSVDIEQRLQSMTLQEKVGQMVQLTFECFGITDAQGVFHVDAAKCDTLFGQYKIGSVLNVPDGHALTPEQWQQLIGDLQKYSMKHIGIPCLFGLDQNHGSTYTQGGTLFPQNINVAATFNREIARQAAEATAYETRAISVPWTFSPTIDLGRDARWPRQWENFGEDCYVNAEMARMMTLGFQGDKSGPIDQQHVAVSLKHYMGYGVPRSGKDRTPASISVTELREKHFAPFLAAIREGAASVMVNSASVNGIPMHANHELLTGWLKEQTGWGGVVITDWADVNNLYTREHVAVDKKDALRIAVNAGIDMIMEPYSAKTCTLLCQLVDEGSISHQRIDDAVRRILQLKQRLGLFEHPTQQLKDYPKLGGSEYAQLAFQAAVESMVLLKNEGNLLPLDPRPSTLKLLVTGPNAHSMRCLNGGWSYTWQGNHADEYAGEYNTIYEALQQEYGAQHVKLCQGVTYNEDGKWWEEQKSDISAVVKAAADADVIVACVGENSYTETPGNLTDLWLSDHQRQLVKALAATGKPIVLVLNEGRPRLIADIVPLARVVVHVMLPGNYGGDALAALLSGRQNFSGRLPYTYPCEPSAQPTYDYKISEKVSTMSGAYDYDASVVWQWPFGYGLSYSSYSYSNLQVQEKHFTPGDTLTVSVDVTNISERPGRESVLLYSSDLVASVVPDNRRLRQFQKITLDPGETRTVTFKLPATDLAFVGADGQWHLEPGDFLLTVGTEQVLVTCDTKKR